MKTAQFLAAALFSLASLTTLAQQGDVSAQASGSVTVASEMSPVNGELANKLDAKSAKAGDPVVVKTTEPVRIANGVVIPKGSRLVGSITEVQAHGSDSPDSHIGIRFDHAELKGGQTLAIQAEIRSLSLPVSSLSMAPMGNDASMGAMGGGGAMGGAGSMSGGGMGGARGGAGGVAAGGALGGTGNGVGNTVGGTPGTLDPSVNGTVRAPGQLAGNVSDAGSRVSASGEVVHSTGVPGVMLSGRSRNASSASGKLWASKQNVHLDGGTQIVFGIAADAH
jgi:hypothetical protein